MSGKITALKVQKRNRERVNVYLDGKFAFGLARIVAAWLRVGQDLSDERIAELKAQDDKEATYQKVLRYLSYRERSEAEIRQYLHKRQVDESLIEDITHRLLRSGLVDDRRFAQRWVENRSEFRPRGRRALSYELRQKGIPNQIIDEVVEQIDEAELAYQAALKRSEKLSQFQWPVFRKKMYAYLSRRGFSYDTAANIVNRVWEETKNTDAS
jgi:regulatory protein